MLLNRPLDAVQLACVEAVVGRQLYWFEPKLGFIFTCLNMDMGRLLPLVAEEEKAEATTRKTVGTGSLVQ
jgi:hypothetical protein